MTKIRFYVDTDGEILPCDEERKSIFINRIWYELPEDVWRVMVCIEAERDYYRKKYMEFVGVVNYDDLPFA